MARKKAAPKGIDRDTDRLYKAVQNYVEKKGGKLAVIGGITIQEWPTDRAMIFYVAVKCMGRKPAFAESGEEQQQGEAK